MLKFVCLFWFVKRGGEAYFVIVTNVASGGGDVAYIVTNLALPLASLS